MRYFYEPSPLSPTGYGLVYRCEHPLYKECTLYQLRNEGLAVVQLRFNRGTKVMWWGSIDEGLAGDIYLNPRFQDYFKEHAYPAKDGLYPTVTVRQIMYALKMKPLKRDIWEGTLDL